MEVFISNIKKTQTVVAKTNNTVVAKHQKQMFVSAVKPSVASVFTDKSMQPTGKKLKFKNV